MLVNDILQNVQVQYCASQLVCSNVLSDCKCIPMQDRLEKLHRNVSRETARQRAAIEAGQ